MSYTRVPTQTMFIECLAAESYATRQNTTRINENNICNKLQESQKTVRLISRPGRLRNVMLMTQSNLITQICKTLEGL